MVRIAAAALGLTLAVVGCGAEPTPPGTLTLTVSGVPGATAGPSVTVAGQVQRTPPAPDVPIVVSVTAGAVVQSDTAATTGAFGFTVALTANALTTITVHAVDATGSEATPLEFTVRQDATGPTIEASSPANVMIDVPASAAVSFTASEPVNQGFLSGIRLERGGIPLGGTLDVSADGRTVTLAPVPALAPGAAYRLRVAGLRDTLGNLQPGAFQSCFVTAASAQSLTFSDPPMDTLSDRDPSGLTPPDLLTLALTASDSALDVLLRFTHPLVHQAGTVSSLFGVLDLDTDQDSTTGVPTIKDVALNGLRPPSGTRAEYMIGLFPFPAIGDSAFAGMKVDTLGVAVRWAFLPVSCGNYYGASIPLGAIGGDLDFNLVGYFSVGGVAGLIDEAAPDSGHYTVALTPFRGPRARLAEPSGPDRPALPVRYPWRSRGIRP